MKKMFFALLCLAASVFTARGQEKKFNCYAVAFYNQENLFDTIHDKGKNDYEFLPEGSYKWNGMKYRAKLANMAKVLAELGTDLLPGVGASVIGVSEVENERVMTDLVNQEPLRARDMRFVHIDRKSVV